MKEQTPVATIGEVPPQGLYDPAHEHDACGAGFVAAIKCRQSHAVVGRRLLGWRDVPPDDRLLGASALNVEPSSKQVFIGRGTARDAAHFERKLYVVRKRIEHAVEAMDFSEKRLTYLPSLSSNTLIYK